MDNKPTIRIKQWHVSGAHVYGKDIDDNNKQVRSPRIRVLEAKDFNEFDLVDGSVLEAHAAYYKLVGVRRRKFSE